MLKIQSRSSAGARGARAPGQPTDSTHSQINYTHDPFRKVQGSLTIFQAEDLNFLETSGILPEISGDAGNRSTQTKYCLIFLNICCFQIFDSGRRPGAYQKVT